MVPNICKSFKNLGCEVIIARMEVKISKGEAMVYSTDKKANWWMLSEIKGPSRLEQLLQSKYQG